MNIETMSVEDITELWLTACRSARNETISRESQNAWFDKANKLKSELMKRRGSTFHTKEETKQHLLDVAFLTKTRKEWQVKDVRDPVAMAAFLKRYGDGSPAPVAKGKGKPSPTPAKPANSPAKGLKPASLQ